MTDEKWKDIPEFEGLYQASNYGNIKSLKRATTSGRVLKQYVSPHNGYAYVTLSKNNIQKQRRVHKLVMLAFHGIYDSSLQINHKDGNKVNNHIDNLELCTGSENMRHAYDTGLEKPTGRQVIDLDTGIIYDTMTHAALSLGAKRGCKITLVCRGQRSHYRNHHFAYYEDYINGSIPEYKGAYRKRSSEALWR